MLLVANDSYQLERASELGARDGLDEGVLQVSALRERTGAALARVVAKATSAGAAVVLLGAVGVRRAAGRQQAPGASCWGRREMVALSTPLSSRILRGPARAGP